MLEHKSDPIYSASEIAQHLGGILIGDRDLTVGSISTIESQSPHSITFFGHPKYASHLVSHTKRVVLVSHQYDALHDGFNTFIKVDNVYEALTRLSELFGTRRDPDDIEISTTAIIHESSTLGDRIHIGHHSVIGKDCAIQDDVVIMEQVYLGARVSIGPGTIIHQGVKIMEDVHIGARCIIQPNAVIGSEGFGYRSSQDGYHKLHHYGTVRIEDNVEIGSNTCIDRGALGDTVIKQGAKLDNLIQIAHGVEIGEHVAIAAQTGISGSAKIGEHSQLGGQVGVVGHISIAPRSRIQAQSGVAGDLKEEGRKWYGYPAISYYKYLRSFALFKRLPELFFRLKQVEDQCREKK